MAELVEGISDPRVTAIIPGVPSDDEQAKYLRSTLGNQPLLQYTLDAVSKVDELDDVVFFSREEDLLEEVEGVVSETIDLSGRKLERDLSRPLLFVQILNILEDRDFLPDLFVLLDPFYPLRTPADIRNVFDLFGERDCDMVLSVVSMKPPQWAVTVPHGYLEPVFGDEQMLKDRGSFPEAFMPVGAVFVSTPEVFRKRKRFLTRRTVPYVLPSDRGIEVRSDADLRIARALLNH